MLAGRVAVYSLEFSIYPFGDPSIDVHVNVKELKDQSAADQRYTTHKADKCEEVAFQK